MQTDLPKYFSNSEFILRPYERRDIGALKIALETSYESILQFLPFAEKEKNLRGLEEFVDTKMSLYLSKKDFTLGIFSLDEKTILGGTGFHLRSHPLDRCWAEVGIWINQDYQRQGIGKRILKAMMEWGFAEWPWRRLEWRTDDRNIGSIRIAESNGFSHSGTIIGYDTDHFGHWRNMKIYNLLKYHPDDVNGNINIKDISLTDVKNLGNIHADAWHDTYTGIMSDDALYKKTPKSSMEWWAANLEKDKGYSRVIGAYNERNQLLGMCSYGKSRSQIPSYESEIYAVNLPRIYQGHGIGRKLLDFAFADLKTQGRKQVYLWVLEKNVRAVGCYSHLGGTKIGDKIEDNLTEIAFGFKL